ncbi:hypothetical protein HELRODRAFT_127547, partial [Helobdella robusta]|uniref:RING-type domain-containing protein n=1 Tax=Helobdella robusta TaxID=6412 RepID=T1EHF3_HELRO
SECVICKEQLMESSCVKEFPCYHVFHDDCINSWLDVKPFCPICRDFIAVDPIDHRRYSTEDQKDGTTQ